LQALAAELRSEAALLSSVRLVDPAFVELRVADGVLSDRVGGIVRDEGKTGLGVSAPAPLDTSSSSTSASAGAGSPSQSPSALPRVLIDYSSPNIAKEMHVVRVCSRGGLTVLCVRAVC
jgi:hypothetical protein